MVPKRLAVPALALSSLAQPALSAMTKNYIVTLKDSASDADVAALKELVTSAGGKITSEYLLIKGFAAELPEDHANTLGTHEHVNSIEPDSEVKIN